jgi:hypothetical protein
MPQSQMMRRGPDIIESIIGYHYLKKESGKGIMTNDLNSMAEWLGELVHAVYSLCVATAWQDFEKPPLEWLQKVGSYVDI